MEGQISQESDSNQNRNNRNPELENCAICQSIVSNPSLTDPCRHKFCLNCIKQWSRNHNRCPICRKSYRKIICNIVSDELFGEIPVLLFARLTALCNQYQRQRGVVFKRLEQNRQTLNCLRDFNQNLDQELKRLDADITQFNTVLSSDSPTEVIYLNALNGREQEIRLIDVFAVNEDTEDNQSNDSMPSLVSSSSQIDEVHSLSTSSSPGSQFHVMESLSTSSPSGPQYNEIDSLSTSSPSGSQFHGMESLSTSSPSGPQFIEIESLSTSSSPGPQFDEIDFRSTCSLPGPFWPWTTKPYSVSDDLVNDLDEEVDEWSDGSDGRDQRKQFRIYLKRKYSLVFNDSSDSDNSDN